MDDAILVIGATGNVGRPLVEALTARGAKVKAASRSGKAVDGAEGVVFDYADPASFGPAFDGVKSAFVMLPTGSLDPKGQLAPVIAAASARKVKVVFLSVLGADADEAIPYRQVERALEASGTPYVILRPNWFADNFHTFWKAGLDHGVIALPAGEGKSSFIDTRDIAESAAAALTSDRFDGRAFNLTGPEALGYGDAAAILATVIGKPVAYTPIDDDTFVGILVGTGVPQDYARFLASIFMPVREGWTSAVTTDVETLTGHAPRSLETYAKDNADRLK
ncbi:SDR family oxidoreductase [Xanthobacter autotrophicus]|uniref:SDR family oxidoreductase n=1 Tax=Xanthobacter autotrophicus TaxID=280 RepID=UPI0024A64F06|nr:SDR family oxidoreductase [Xanthobacter autotrophicus]MDI4658843.1 SDR family oxidoreductase [Xanthobacter autotrophicus]